MCTTHVREGEAWPANPVPAGLLLAKEVAMWGTRHDAGGWIVAKAELIPRVPTTVWILCTLNYIAGTRREKKKPNRWSSEGTWLWGVGYAGLHPTPAHSHSWIPPGWQPGLWRAPLGGPTAP